MSNCSSISRSQAHSHASNLHLVSFKISKFGQALANDNRLAKKRAIALRFPVRKRSSKREILRDAIGIVLVYASNFNEDGLH